MTIEDPIDLARTNVLERKGGRISVNKRWPRKTHTKGPPALPDEYQKNRGLARAFDALQLLQASRDMHLSPTGLNVPLEYLHDSLPEIVKQDVHIFPAEAKGPFSSVSSSNASGTGTETGIVTGALLSRDKFNRNFRPHFMNKPYHFWPIEINRSDGNYGGSGSGGTDHRPPHWGLIFMNIGAHHVEPSDPYIALKDYVIINPDYGKDARKLEDDIDARLRQILQSNGVDVSMKTRRRTWVPPSMYIPVFLTILAMMNAPQVKSTDQGEYWSSGLRVFEMMRIWLERMTEFYCYSPGENIGNKETFWVHPHPGWFNADFVRSSMIGMAASQVNIIMQSTTRIGIEPILDGAMKNETEKTAIKTVSMLPDSTNNRAYQPSENRDGAIAIMLDENEGGEEGGEEGGGENDESGSVSTSDSDS